jgi:drug/metabolite transporter (DMT)-like permease
MMENSHDKNIFFVESPTDNFSKTEQPKPKNFLHSCLQLDSSYSVTIGGLISSTAIIVSIFLTKLTNLNVSNMACINFGVQLIFYLPLYMVFKQNLLGPQGFRLLLLFRGFTGSISIIAAYFSIRMICFNEALSLRYLSSIILVVLASIMLKERLKTLHYVSIFLGVVGSILIVRPVFLFRGIGAALDTERSIGRTFFLCLFTF